MPLIVANANLSTPTAAGSRPLRTQLERALGQLPPRAPIVLLIHGYRFSPGTPGKSPHTHVLALTPDPGCRRAVSWPRKLGCGPGPHAGLAIAFGWEARGTIWRAYAEARRAGLALAGLLTMIDALAPGRRVGVLAHSLGARVFLAGLGALPRPVVGRAVLLSAAEFRRPACEALATRAGRAAEIVNVISAQNDLFDTLLECLMPHRHDRALGRGLPQAPARWLDLMLDHGPTLAALAASGHRIDAPAPGTSHWSVYLRPGAFDLYRALLCQNLGINALPAPTEPLRPRAPIIPNWRLPLPPAAKAPQ